MDVWRPLKREDIPDWCGHHQAPSAYEGPIGKSMIAVVYSCGCFTPYETTAEGK